MKKMSGREMLMTIVLMVGIVGYGFLTFVWDPMQIKKEEVEMELQNIKSELAAKNVSQLNLKKKQLQSDKGSTHMKIEQIKKEKTFGNVKYQDLIEYLGKEADSLGVDVIQFKKYDSQNSNVYWEIPYEMTVQGNYQGIIHFVNSLYNLENYFFITGMDMREVARVPMTDKVHLGDGELKGQIGFDWASEFIERLDRTIPSELKSEMEQDFMKEFVKEMDAFAKEMEEELLSEQKDIKINDQLELKFMFHFVSLENPDK